MYFFYIDDSGSRDPSFESVRPDGTTVPKDPVYVLTAVGFYEKTWRPIEEELTDWKLRLRRSLRESTGLITDIMDCEVKSTWLRNPIERKSRSPFLHALSDEQRGKLVELYYSQLEKHHAHLISVVVDKRYLQTETTGAWMHLKAYEILLERIELLLAERFPKHQGLVVMDDSERELNRAVAMMHARLLHRGGRRIYFNHIAEYPFFTESSLSHGIQLADLCAYNVHRAFRNEDYAYPFFTRMLPFFYNSANTDPGKLDGLKVFPECSPWVAWVAESCRQKNGPAPSAGPSET